MLLTDSLLHVTIMTLHHLTSLLRSQTKAEQKVDGILLLLMTTAVATKPRTSRMLGKWCMLSLCTLPHKEKFLFLTLNFRKYLPCGPGLYIPLVSKPQPLTELSPFFLMYSMLAFLRGSTQQLPGNS